MRWCKSVLFIYSIIPALVSSGSHGGVFGGRGSIGGGHSSTAIICEVENSNKTERYNVRCYTSCCHDGCCPVNETEIIVIVVLSLLVFLYFLYLGYRKYCKKGKEQSEENVLMMGTAADQSGNEGKDNQNYGSAD